MLRDRFKLPLLFKSLLTLGKFGRLRAGKNILLVTSSSPPWDTWDLDPKFFAALSRWTVDHPESSLDRVLEKVCVGIDNGQELLGLVPDHPFPARGLIGALAHLVKLGVAVSRAKIEVRTFSKEIIRWVGEVKSAFEHDSDGLSTRNTRKNLKEMRILIEEICKWATARLRDSRWSRISHGLSIKNEIDDFKSRIVKARAIFMELSMITLSQGQDDIRQSVRFLISSIQKTQAKQLSDIREELDEQKRALEEQKQAEDRRQFLSQTLSPRAVENTAYGDQGKRPCDSNTRTDILADIKEWIHDISDDTQSFLWLTGDPGSGKSAVTASVARECKDDGILWAQYFINRNIGNTTNPASYFPSIARQLADHSSDVAVAIHDVLKQEKPSLMDDISQHQAGKLFVESLEAASCTDPSKPVVVIIDGLDETDTTRLRFTAEIFSKAVVDLPRNVKVFVSSRTDDNIQRPFSAMRGVKKVHLDTSTESSIRDVSTFLRTKIAEIVEQNGPDWLQWPGEQRMARLCRQASGLFIWAVTTTKFIQEQVETSGTECLDDVLDELNTKGMGDLNMLYNTILRRTYKDQDPWIYERFRRIVGCIVVLQEPLCLADLDSLLDLHKTTSSRRVDIEKFVRRFRTVLVAGAGAIDGHTIPRLHKSFFEFITSERADHRFRIDMVLSNGETAILCLRQLAGLRAIAGNGGPRISRQTGDGYFPALHRYACRFWSTHLPPAEAMMAVACSITLPELQELSRLLGDGTHPSSVTVAPLPDRKQIVSSSDNILCLWDADSGAPIESPLKGHRHIVSSVAFSPDGKKIVSGSWDNTLRLWDARVGQPIGPLFQGHTAAVLCVAFSPDGRHIISGSCDSTLRLWDAQSGQPIGSPFEGHALAVRCAAFSPDGKQIISGSWDRTLRLWDTQSHQQIGLPFEGHRGAVYSVAFSPDGTKIMSCSWDNTLRLWDPKSHQRILSFKGHTSTINSAAFSPDGERIISGSWDKTLRLWDVRSGRLVGSPFEGHTKAVYSVAFSPDGKQIISASWDHTLRLWDVAKGHPIGLPFKGHANTVNSVAFSPDGKQVVSASSDCLLRLWDVGTGQPIEFPIIGHTDMVTSIAISPDSMTIVSASSDDTVRVWSAQTGVPNGSCLEGDIREINSLAFSPDGCKIAAASLDGSVCLWDMESRRLLASYNTDQVNGLVSITFSPDGSQLQLFSVDGTSRIWDATNGKPIEILHSSSDMSRSDESQYFSSDKGWCQDEVDGALLRWVPVHNPEFGLWGYIDGHVVRSHRNGSTTIFDVSDILRTRGMSP